MGRSPHKKMMERDNAEDYKIARDALRVVGLEEFGERNFSTLSGGEQQRVILARALTQQTECLVLDEPTNHLDIKYQLEIMDIVKSLDVTVIAAVHDLNIAAMYCDCLIAISGEKWRELVHPGTPDGRIYQRAVWRRQPYRYRRSYGSDEYRIPPASLEERKGTPQVSTS